MLNICWFFAAQIPGTTQDHLQIFNIEAKTKIKSHQMPEQVQNTFQCCCIWHFFKLSMRCTWSNMFHIFTFQLQVVFWKWITPKLLGLVTQASVYHWSIEGDSEPTKMFDRAANLANNQIINYRCDPAEKWLVLIGIAPGAPEVWSYINLLLVTPLLVIDRSHVKWVFFFEGNSNECW